MIFTLERTITLADFRDLLIRSTLAERRPADDESCLQGMIDHADLLASCWDGDRLIGLARSVTDFHYCCYLSDLAVDRDSQKQGIGRELIALTQSRLGPHCKLILLSAPDASTYYPKLGFTQHLSAWFLPRDRSV